MDFVAFDVETANNTPGSICSIGMAGFENDKLTTKYYSLIRPPEDFGGFNYFCEQVHGITTSDVVQAPNFKQVYLDIEQFIEGRLLVAHNSSFDARHLNGIMNYYDIGATYDFTCTLALARRMLTLPNYKLDTVCNYLGVQLKNYHNALDDAIACGKIYSILMER
jgi:DNA polymerase-3 subunit epsilon